MQCSVTEHFLSHIHGNHKRQWLFAIAYRTSCYVMIRKKKIINNHRAIKSVPRYYGQNNLEKNVEQRSLQRNPWNFTRLLGQAPNGKRKRFSFNDYNVVGFDLDNTLLRYNLNTMLRLIYDELRVFLVKEKKYLAQLTEQKFDPDFLQRGLVLDADKGNILKLSNTATILRAAHGTRMLSNEDIVKVYGPDRQWHVSTKFFHEPLSTWNGPLSTKLRTLLDYFDMPVSLVFAQAVDVIDEEAQAQGKNPPKIYKVWADILDGLIYIYARDNFANGRSKYFASLIADPSIYLMRTSDSVLQWLKKLRESGKMLFLLTGSNIDFANLTASYALGENWRELFDCVVCFAKKPGFYTMQRPYLQVIDNAEVKNSEMDLKILLKKNGTYSQGNWKQLQATLADILGKSPTKVRTLYIGDNLIQDVYTPAKHSDLDAVVLCEELYGDQNFKRSPYEFRDMVNSKFWGSYFCIDNQPTLWSAMIGDYAKLCVASIDELAKESISHKFTCSNHHGFFPEAPADLIVEHVKVG